MASLTSLHQNIQQSSIDCNGPKQTTIDLVGGILCKICRLTFATKQAYDIHYRTHGDSIEITYTCNICYKEIVGYPSFRGHCYTSHVIKERFQCEHCLKQFSKISSLKDHVNRIHKFKCPTCRKEFPSKKEMLLHKIIHNSVNQPPYNCNTCKIEIDTADECKEHVDKHLKFLYSCPICNDNISDKKNAADHMKKHFGDVLSDDKNIDETPKSEDTSEEFSGIMCQFCSLVLGDRVKFDAHFSCKHGDEDIVYMCVECGKSFEKYSVFKNHCYNHSLKNRYKCEICKKAFPRLSMLAAHTVACQGAGLARSHRGKVFACPACSRRFASMSRWREHLRVAHDMHRHLPCPHERCDRTFDTPRQLILHQQSHEITNQNFCSQCRLVFSNVAACERHLDMHRKKVFFCPICKRNAKDKKVIMNHVSQHFDVMSHLCRVCGKIYNTKKGLVEHLKTHKKVKSYSCTHCNKSFLKPSQLEQHVNTHTGVKPYKCPICVKSFSNYPNWVKHVRRMHHEESIYIRNPIIDHSDSVDKEDLATRTTVIEENYLKSNNALNNEIRADDKKDNNNYRILHTKEQLSDMKIDGNITDIKKDNNDDTTIIGMESAISITAIETYKIVNDVINSSDEIKFNVVEVNHNQNFNIPNQIFDNTVTTDGEASEIEIAINKEIGITKDIQNGEVDQMLITDDQNSSAYVSSKPHKCPICEKTFAKYSYMSKHVGRVHHIRSIDIKNLLIDHKDGVNGDSSAMETMFNDDNEISTDNTKEDNDEPVENTEKQKIQVSSTIESHVHGLKPYKCPNCDKSFAKYPYMTKHVRKVHDKKNIDVKNPIHDHTGVVDDVTAMETGINEEIETSSDNTNNDNNEQVSNPENHNIDHNNPMNLKAHRCPVCDKSFAKYPYMTKHARKVHKQKIINMKNPLTENKEIIDEELSAMETWIDADYDISRENINEDSMRFQSTGQLPNVEHFSNIESKPYKCPTCDKSFAKHSYMSKHVRTVHNKKNIDIKNPMIENKDNFDDDGSMVDEDNEIFTDHSKDDNDERVLNKVKYNDIDCKPYKCPMCDKSFAKDRYCRKHVRRVHYKTNTEIKNPTFNTTNGPGVGTLMDNEISVQSVANLDNQPDTSDCCLNDIDEANASIDFANVRLENYIFSVQRDSPMDIVPSMQDGKYLVTANNDGNIAIDKHLFKENCEINPLITKNLMYDRKLNSPIVTDLINENGEAIDLVEKDLFNENIKESTTVGKDLFNGNNEENNNPIDILEYIAEMPENNSLFVPVISQECLAPSAQQAVEASTYPCEYGPEFSGFDADCTSGFIDLDDHMLPHIDPLLTINNQTCVQMQSNYQNYDYNVIEEADLLALGNEACNKMYAQNNQSYNEYNVTVSTADYEPGWNPPIITKLCDQYAYGYGEMPEASRVPIMNTDIF